MAFPPEGHPGRRRHLPASGLLPYLEIPDRPTAVAAGRLARRLSVPVPRLHLRSGRPRLQEQAVAGQPAGAALHVRRRGQTGHRQGRERGGVIMAFQEKQLPADASSCDKALNWVDARFPLSSTWKAHLSEYYAPKNFNFLYVFGSLALLVLAIQIVTGIFLVMHYKPDANLAFASVEYIMRDVPWGWLVRYMHSTGASAFFVVVYIHMLRGLLYGSYRKPRELVWLFGVGIFLCLMAEAFFGYLLPWGQMSYWGAQVIVNLFGAIPFIGPDLSLWIRGDYVVSDATLNRFFSFH